MSLLFLLSKPLKVLQSTRFIPFFCAAILHVTPIAAPAAPDIVVFITDDHSQLDVSPYADRGLNTPNAQKLADSGVTFDQAFVASPSCAPSRSALLTGLMPARNGAEENHAKPRPELMKWPAYFQQLGYDVVAFGKVAHYEHTAYFGFDKFAHDTFHDHAGIPAAAEFLKKRADSKTTRPLCLMVGSNWPHVPWPEKDPKFDDDQLTLPPGSVDTTETRRAWARFATAVEKADADLGLVHTAVREHLASDTLFMFTSDHGTQWPFGKWNCYDAGIRVPLIVEWPGVNKPGTRTDAMVSWVDILPTLLEVAGGKAPENIDGRSFAAAIKGDDYAGPDYIFTTHSGDGNLNVYPIRSIRTREWKLILNLYPEYAYATHIDLPGHLGRTPYWRSWEEAAATSSTAAAAVKRYHQRPPVELYNLVDDPHEMNNLAADPAHADRLRQMRANLEAWMEQQGDKRKVYGTPRLLSDPTSYGVGAFEKARADQAKQNRQKKRQQRRARQQQQAPHINR